MVVTVEVENAFQVVGFLGLPGGIEWLVILVVALLLFGRRLPDVMRSMGRGVVEFKRGIRGLEDDVENSSDSSDQKYVPENQQKVASPPQQNSDN